MWSTSPFPPHPRLLAFLDAVFPRRYAFDVVRTSAQLLGHSNSHGAAYHAIVHHPNPPYPFEAGSWLASLFPEWFYHASLRSHWPLYFAIAYYTICHALNRLVVSRGKVDYVARSRVLKYAVLAHNLALMLYSAWTWLHLFPAFVDYYLQALRVGGAWQGYKMALCSFSNEAPYIGRYNYLFYLSKYYEVIDSVILLLKGKKVGQLQSYHHAGALISMWIAVRFGSENVIIFSAWNSFVHTLMYTYYFCAAMRWPFPRALKRNLTTLQISQIASGTLYTNLHWLFSIHPKQVLANAARRSAGIRSTEQLKPLLTYAADAATAATSKRSSLLARAAALLLPSALLRAATSRALAQTPVGEYSPLSLLHNARLRAAAPHATTCFDSTGAVLALWVNTLYMLPLLLLFAQFFVRSYLRGGAPAGGVAKGKARAAHANGNGNANGAAAKKRS